MHKSRLCTNLDNAQILTMHKSWLCTNLEYAQISTMYKSWLCSNLLQCIGSLYYAHHFEPNPAFRKISSKQMHGNLQKSQAPRTMHIVAQYPRLVFSLLNVQSTFGGCSEKIAWKVQWTIIECISVGTRTCQTLCTTFQCDHECSSSNVGPDQWWQVADFSAPDRNYSCPPPSSLLYKADLAWQERWSFHCQGGEM